MTMENSLYLRPETCLEFWRQINILNYLNHQKCKNDSLFNILENSYSDALTCVCNINAEIESKIKDAINKYTTYLFIPDLCKVVFSESNRELNDTLASIYIPDVMTSRPFTFKALSDILLGEPHPKTIMFMLSENCNLNCKYCFEKHVDNCVLTFEDAKYLIDSLFTDEDVIAYTESDKKRSIILSFMGGEPLLHSKLISKICDYFIDTCIKYEKIDWLLFHQFEMTSNGTLYFDSDVQNLLYKYPEMHLTISLDGTKECHDSNRVYTNGKGSYDDAIAAIKEEIKQHRINIPRMTFTKGSIKYLFESVKNFHSLGVSAVSIAPVTEDVYTVDDAIDYYNELLKIVDYLYENNIPDFVDLFNMTLAVERCKTEPFCGGECGMLTILPNGNFSTCHRMHDYANSTKSVLLGNTKDGFLKTEGHKANFEYLKSHNIFNRKWPSKCNGCLFIGWCVGCPADSYEINGNLDSDITINCCYLNLARYAAGIYYQAKIQCKINRPYIEENKDKFLMFLPESEVDTLIEIERMYS